jgi:hypothetical protein
VASINGMVRRGFHVERDLMYSRRVGALLGLDGGASENYANLCPENFSLVSTAVPVRG